MKREHENLLMLALSEDLTSDQKEEFGALLGTDPGFRAEWEGMERTRALLRRTPAAAFDPHFATRVMARVGRRQESLADGLVRLFRPLVPVSVAVGLALSLLNWRDRDLMGEGASALEAAFSMPVVSVETADLLDL